MAVAILLVAVLIAALIGIVFKIKSTSLPDATEEVCSRQTKYLNV